MNRDGNRSISKLSDLLKLSANYQNTDSQIIETAESDKKWLQEALQEMSKDPSEYIIENYRNLKFLFENDINLNVIINLLDDLKEWCYDMNMAVVLFKQADFFQFFKALVFKKTDETVLGSTLELLAICLRNNDVCQEVANSSGFCLFIFELMMKETRPNILANIIKVISAYSTGNYVSIKQIVGLVQQNVNFLNKLILKTSSVAVFTNILRFLTNLLITGQEDAVQIILSPVCASSNSSDSSLRSASILKNIITAYFANFVPNETINIILINGVANSNSDTQSIVSNSLASFIFYLYDSEKIKAISHGELDSIVRLFEYLQNTDILEDSEAKDKLHMALQFVQSLYSEK